METKEIVAIIFGVLLWLYIGSIGSAISAADLKKYGDYTIIAKSVYWCMVLLGFINLFAVAIFVLDKDFSWMKGNKKKGGT